MTKTIKDIAKQWSKITNKEISESYNNGKIVDFNDIDDIKILKQSQDIFIMMSKKAKHPSKIDLLIEEFIKFRKEMLDFKKDVTKRLDNIEQRLDEHDQMFKAHGWIN